MGIKEFLEEDLGTGDVTSETLLGDEVAVGVITAKQDCVVAGLEEAVDVFRRLGLEPEALVNDGQRVDADRDVLSVNGLARPILAGERLALNILSRMSGIATQTARLVELVREHGDSVRVAATRKTTPGFREYEKKAVVLGGGDPHRFGLYDSILIKDNHLKMVGGVAEAVKMAKQAGFTCKVEVEVENLGDAILAVESGADIVMLDNMAPHECAEAYDAIKQLDPKVTVEISGGITPENITDYCRAADVISLGWLTHSVPSVDFSMYLEPDEE